MSITAQERPLTVDDYSEWNTAALARRTMLKGAFAGAGGIALSQFHSHGH
jgi:hypothetical protein